MSHSGTSQSCGFFIIASKTEYVHRRRKRAVDHWRSAIRFFALTERRSTSLLRQLEKGLTRGSSRTPQYEWVYEMAQSIAQQSQHALVHLQTEWDSTFLLGLHQQIGDQLAAMNRLFGDPEQKLWEDSE
jgi:hypothetical protein